MIFRGLAKCIEREPVANKMLEEEPIDAMEIYGKKLIDRVWRRYEQGRQSSMVQLRAKARLIPIVANYVRGNALLPYVQDVWHGINEQVSVEFYATREEVDRDMLEADLVLDLMDAKRELSSKPGSFTEEGLRQIVLWFRCFARSTTSDEAFVRYKAITSTNLSKEEFTVMLADQAEYRLHPHAARMSSAESRTAQGVVLIADELTKNNRMIVLEEQANRISSEEERKQFLTNILRHALQESQFEKPFLHLIARTIRELGVTVLMDDAALMRSLMERCDVPVKQAALVRVLAEQGAFDELALLKRHEKWNTAWKTVPTGLYDAVLVSLAKRNGNRTASSQVLAPGVFRSSASTSLKTPQDVDYWFEEWQRDMSAGLQDDELTLAQKKRELFLRWSKVYARMALSVPLGPAKEYVEKMETCLENYWGEQRELTGLAQHPIPRGLSHVLTLDQARAYAAPDTLQLEKFDLMNIDEQHEKQVLEIGLLLIRHAAKRRLATTSV